MMAGSVKPEEMISILLRRSKSQFRDLPFKTVEPQFAAHPFWGRPRESGVPIVPFSGLGCEAVDEVESDVVRRR
jgi:hypothetical protein